MAQAIQERPPDPVVHPTCEYCAKGDKLQWQGHYEPRMHVLEPEEGGWEKRQIICPLSNHPFVVKRFTRIASWIDWRKLWDEAQTYEQLLGLLHVGLDVSRYGCAWEDPILFYLALADRWKDSYSSSAHEKNTVNALKAKAWKTLSMHYWKQDKDSQYVLDNYWAEFLKPELGDPIMDFFLRPDNLPRSDSEMSENRAAYAFLDWLVNALWRRSTTDDLRHLISDQSRREKVMRLLIKMEKWGDLMRPSGGLTRADRRFLKRLALAGTDPGTTLWKVHSGVIRDYQKCGNQAIARVLVNDFIAKRELARVEQVRRVERKKEREEHRQREIEAARRDLLASTKRIQELMGGVTPPLVS